MGGGSGALETPDERVGSQNHGGSHDDLGGEVGLVPDLFHYHESQSAESVDDHDNDGEHDNDSVNSLHTLILYNYHMIKSSADKTL